MDGLAEVETETPTTSRRFRKRYIGWAFVAWWAIVAGWNVVKPMPPGTNVSTALIGAQAEDVQFLYDLTTIAPNGAAVHEQRIFDEVFRIIDDAQSFVVADF